MNNFVLFLVSAILLCFAFYASPQAPAKMTRTSPVERGKMLVASRGCNNCHTPKILTDKETQLDMTRLLSGRPADDELPDLPAIDFGPGKWGAVSSYDRTAFYGPWGVSFAANLTPDLETGLGSWSEQMFIQALRTGKHMGATQGRSILRPMPWQEIGSLPDEDLKAIWAYLRSLRPVKNAVPDPIPPQTPSID